MIAGGASLSLHSLTAATLGAAACVPLLMLRVGMWSSQARSRFPVLEEVQRWQADVSSPVLHNMTHVQVLAAPYRPWASCHGDECCMLGVHVRSALLVLRA